MLLAGATLLTESTPEPSRTIRFLERARLTLFRGWPDQAARIASHPDFATAKLASLRPASLAAVLPPAQHDAWHLRSDASALPRYYGPLAQLARNSAAVIRPLTGAWMTDRT